MWGAVARADEYVAEIRAGTVGSGPTRIVRARSRAGQRAAVFAHRAEHADEYFRVLVRGSRGYRGSRKPVRRRLRKPVRRRLRKPARARDIARDIALSIAVVLFAERGEIANGGVSMNRSSASIQRREETHASVPQSRRGLANRVRQSNDAHVTRRGGPRGRVGAPGYPGAPTANRPPKPKENVAQGGRPCGERGVPASPAAWSEPPAEYAPKPPSIGAYVAAAAAGPSNEFRDTDKAGGGTEAGGGTARDEKSYADDW